MAGPTWDATFRSALADRKLQGLRVSVVLGPTYTPSLGGPAPTADIAFRNFGEDTATGFNCLGNTCKVAGGSLDPVRWTTTAEQLTVQVVNEQAIRAALDAGVHRGTVVEVRVTLPGDNPATEYYRVWIGRLQNIQTAGQFGGRTVYTLTAYGVQSLMQTRRLQTGTLSGTAAALLGESKLFYDVGAATYITPLGYTVGDANLAVNDTSDFKRESTGALLLDDGTNTFYLTYTGIAANAFTGVSATGKFGTTAANMAAGGTSTVTHVAYLTGHPLDILRRVLQSTGAGTNGTWDDYPGAWGLGIPDELCDDTDIADWKTNVVDSTLVYHILVHTAQENTWSWLSSWISKAGIAVVLYEGRISVRCAQDIADATPIRGDWNPVDGAIESAAWSLAESRSGYEYVVVTTSTAATPFFNPLASTYGSLLYTIPGGGWLEVDLRDVSYRETGYGDIEADVEARRWHWVCGIPERVEVTAAHRGPAVLCPGDIVQITSAALFGVPESASATDTYDTVDALVVDGPAVDWLASQPVRLALDRYRDETPPAE